MSIKFGVIGPGNIARKFAQAVEMCPDAELYAVASRDIARAQDFAEKYGAQVAYGSNAEMFADPEVQAVYIATPHNSHVAIACEAIEHGKAVICEKPIGVDYAETEKLVNLAREKSVFLMEAMWTRNLPSYKAVKKWVTEGKIGTVNFMSSAFSFRAKFNPDARLFNPALAGGALLDLGCYTTAYTLGIMGEYPCEIAGVAHIGTTKVDENASVSMKFPSGAIAQMNFGINVATGNQATIYGTEGKITMEQFHCGKNAKCYNAQGELIAEHNDEHENGFVFQVEEMCKLLGAGKTESEAMSLKDTLDCMRVMDSLQKQFYK